MPFTPIDYVFLGIIAIAVIRCAIRGFIAEILSMAALILGIGCAVFFSSPASRIVDAYIGESFWSPIIAFLAIFIVVYLVVKIIQGLLSKVIEKIHLDKLDKSLGLLLGLVEGVIVITLIVFVLQVQPFFDTQAWLEKGTIPAVILKIFSFEAGTIQIKAQEVFNSLGGNLLWS